MTTGLAMAWCRASLLLAAALVGLALATPVPRADSSSSSSPAVSRALDLLSLDPRLRSMPPDFADAEPLPKYRTLVRQKAGKPHPPRRQGVPQAAESDPYRLPMNIRPILYQVLITPNFDDFTFSGSALIVIHCLEDTKNIVIHSKQLTISDVEVLEDNDDGYAYTNVVKQEFDEEHDFLRLTLGDAVKKQNRYRLYFEYKGILNDDLDGFYRSSYKVGGETRWIATTQFEETGARRAWPCFDEPGLKARFYVIIDHDKTRNAISNMPTVKTPEQQFDGTVRVTYDATLPMSTYLVAFIVSDFGSETNEYGNFTIWARKDILKGGQFSQDIGQKAISLLGEFMGIPYALPKEDQAAIPDFAAGAMENWGLVTYREEYVIESDSQTIRIAEYMMTTICHELGHQWTGDLVTLDWWSHTWLNEGFADYLENYICNEIKPEWHLIDKAVVSDHQTAMEKDTIETQHAMSSPVSTPEEDTSKFDRISYAKGGAVIRMWEHFLGVDVLKKGLNRYLSINMFKNTNPEHLFKAINFEAQKANVLPAGVSFPDIARTWTEQPGVPVVNVIRDYDDSSVVLTQERFFYSKPNRHSLVDQRWYIPLTLVEQKTADWGNTKPTTWLAPHKDKITHKVKAGDSDWVLANPKEIGYFRVNYDLNNWKLLSKALIDNPDSFPSATRSQLLNDAVNLARAQMLDYPVALNLFNSLKAEREVASWQTATTALSYLRSMLAGTDAFPNFLAFVRKITDSAYNFVGYSGAVDHERRYLRYYVVSQACYAGNKDCIKSANDLLKSWLAGTETKLDADTQAVTMCHGLRGSDGAANFAGLKKKWLAEEDADTRAALLQALVCTQDEALLTGLLTDAVNSKLSIKQDEVVSMWNAVLARPEQQKIILDFAEKNYQQIWTYFNSSGDPCKSEAFKLLVACFKGITSTDQLTDARWWVEDNFANKAGYDKLQAAFLEAYDNLEWYRSNYKTVSDWLQTASAM